MEPAGPARILNCILRPAVTWLSWFAFSVAQA